MRNLLSILFLGLSVSSASASQIFVEPATGSGVSESDLSTTTQLIQNSISDVSSDQVANTKEQADFSLRPHLMKLGQAYELGLQKINKDGSIAFSSQLKAQKMDELDKVADRVTEAVLSGKRASDDARVGQITNQEAHDGTQRKPVRKEWYIGLGGASLNNLQVSGIGYSFGLAHAWDFNSGLFKILGEFSSLSGAFYASAGIGGEYFLLSGDLAPYLSADFGLGTAKAEGNSGFFSGSFLGGFDIGIGAGVEIMRTSSINLDLAFRAGFLLRDDGNGMPNALSLKLGLYF